VEAEISDGYFHHLRCISSQCDSMELLPFVMRTKFLVLLEIIMLSVAFSLQVLRAAIKRMNLTLTNPGSGLNSLSDFWYD